MNVREVVRVRPPRVLHRARLAGCGLVGLLPDHVLQAEPVGVHGTRSPRCGRAVGRGIPVRDHVDAVPLGCHSRCRAGPRSSPDLRKPLADGIARPEPSGTCRPRSSQTPGAAPDGRTGRRAEHRQARRREAAEDDPVAPSRSAPRGDGGANATAIGTRGSPSAMSRRAHDGSSALRSSTLAGVPRDVI